MRWNIFGRRRGDSFLVRLARDRGGNTLAMMAVALIPLSALAGSAVDTARLYVAKVRLQQACDAGALAGRKFLVDSNVAALDDNAATQARTFFDNNFKLGWLGTTDVSTSANRFVPVKTADQQVAGSAQVKVPMTIMKMFAAPDVTLRVTCEARYDVADTDIVFVLDTTGSMACLPKDTDTQCSDYVNSAGNNSYTRPDRDATVSGSAATAGYVGSKAYSVPEKSGSRISALRKAVKDFYAEIAKDSDPSTHIRYGFVTYSSAVNAGAAVMSVSPSYMVGGSGTGTAPYQSRSVTADYTISSSTSTNSSISKKSDCDALDGRSPAPAKTYFSSGNAKGTATLVDATWITPTTGSAYCSVKTNVLGPHWTYQQVQQDVSGFVAGGAVTDPTRVDGSTTRWIGCIEERQTNPGQSTFDTDKTWPTYSTGLPPDLDPELKPANDAQRWKPMWPAVVWGKNQFKYGGNYYYFTEGDGDTQGTNSGQNPNANTNYNTDAKQTSGNVACGKPIQRVATMTKDQVGHYVDAADFVPLGGTYHDIGMIWGVRLLSAKGIFGNDTSAWTGRNPPKRVIVFLTDGDMSPSLTSYGLYGVEVYDQRVTGGDFANQKDYHNKRLLAECQRAKDLDINIWTVSIAPAATDEMTQCASVDSQALYSTDGADLASKFQSIAKQVAMLRVSK